MRDSVRIGSLYINRVNSQEDQPVVLVVEDDEGDTFMLRRAFKQLGFQTAVQYVRNGEEAVAYLLGIGRFGSRTEYPLPDLLLLDLKMPRKNGFEVLAWIREQPGLKHLRVAVLTTSDDAYEIDRAYKLGAASFLTKPLNFTEFRDAIQAIHNFWLRRNKSPALERPGTPVSGTRAQQ
jgi:CheY-like chemotaxis protein